MEQYQIEQKLEEGYLHCKIMLEILGAPQKHVEDTLNLVLKRLREEKDVYVLVESPQPAKPHENLFSAFAESDILFKDFQTLVRIIFDYMPSSIDIIKPNNFKLPSIEVASFVNDIIAALHNIDYKLKDARASNVLLEKNSANLLKNFTVLVLTSGKKSINQISSIIGIKPEQLDKFLQAFSQEGIIKKSGDLWEKV